MRGRQVLITKGPYKGYIGEILTQEKGDYIIILATDGKRINVSKENVLFSNKRKNSESTERDTKKYKRSSSSITESVGKSSNSSRESGSLQNEKEYKDNFQFFNFIQEQNKKDSLKNDVEEFLKTMNIDYSYELLKNFTDDIKEIINSKSIKSKEINIKLFIVAYFFVHFNTIGSNIPYEPYYREFVAPNDNFLYILNASIYKKFINKNINPVEYQNYIKDILEYKGTFIKKYVTAKSIKYSKRKTKQVFVPQLETMRFFSKKLSNDEIFREKQQLINNVINNLKTKKIPPSINMDELIKKLTDMLYNKPSSISPKNPSPTDDLFKKIKTQLNSELAKRLDTLSLRGEEEIENLVKSQIKDFVKLKIKDSDVSTKEKKILNDYSSHIGDRGFIDKLDENDKKFVENYNKAYVSLLKFNLQNRKSTI